MMDGFISEDRWSETIPRKNLIGSKEEDLDAPFGVAVATNNDPVISTTAIIRLFC